MFCLNLQLILKDWHEGEMKKTKDKFILFLGNRHTNGISTLQGLNKCWFLRISSFHTHIIAVGAFSVNNCQIDQSKTMLQLPIMVSNLSAMRQKKVIYILYCCLIRIELLDLLTGRKWYNKYTVKKIPTIMIRPIDFAQLIQHLSDVNQLYESQNVNHILFIVFHTTTVSRCVVE